MVQFRLVCLKGLFLLLDYLFEKAGRVLCRSTCGERPKATITSDDVVLFATVLHLAGENRSVLIRHSCLERVIHDDPLIKSIQSIRFEPRLDLLKD